MFLKYFLRYLRHEKDISGVVLKTGMLKKDIFLELRYIWQKIRNIVVNKKSWLSLSEPLKSPEPDSLKFSGDSTGEFFRKLT